MFSFSVRSAGSRRVRVTVRANSFLRRADSRVVCGPFADRKRRVNQLIWEGLQKRGEAPIAFFCECDDEHCYQAVWLTASAIEEARLDPEWLALVPGHRAVAESIAVV